MLFNNEFITETFEYKSNSYFLIWVYLYTCPSWASIDIQLFLLLLFRTTNSCSTKPENLPGVMLCIQHILWPKVGSRSDRTFVCTKSSLQPGQVHEPQIEYLQYLRIQMCQRDANSLMWQGISQMSNHISETFKSEFIQMSQDSKTGKIQEKEIQISLSQKLQQIEKIREHI